MTIPETPPRGMRWANTDSAKAATTVVALVALIVSGYLFFRLQSYVDCVANQQLAASMRTAAIASATDAEREADRALVSGPMPGGPDADELRRRDIAARANTDRVRKDNPPAPVESC